MAAPSLTGFNRFHFVWELPYKKNRFCMVKKNRLIHTKIRLTSVKLMRRINRFNPANRSEKNCDFLASFFIFFSFFYVLFYVILTPKKRQKNAKKNVFLAIFYVLFVCGIRRSSIENSRESFSTLFYAYFYNFL